MKRVVLALLAMTSIAHAQEEDGLCADHVMDPPALAWRESGLDATRPAAEQLARHRLRKARLERAGAGEPEQAAAQAAN